METSISNYIVQSSKVDWKLLEEPGINTKGIFVKSLRQDKSANRSPTILLKFEPGSTYPYHNHPGGEELFVLEGEVSVEGTTLSAGDYLYTPPGFRHGVTSESGCTLLLMIPEEVEIL